MNKKTIAFIVAASLLVVGAVPVFAAVAKGSAPKRYIPVSPRFISGDIHGNWNIPLLEGVLIDEYSYMSSLSPNSPSFLFLVQGTHTNYYPPGVPNSPNVGLDKQWSLVIYTPHLGPTQGVNFGVFDPLTYADSSAHPIQIICNSVSADISTFYYDYENNSFSSPVRDTWDASSPLSFSYLLWGGHTLEEKCATYPYYRLMDKTHPINVAPRDVGDPIDYYSWWTTIKAIGGADTPSAPTSSEDDSSSVGGGGDTSSGGGGDSGDGHIFNPIKPFDPWDDQYKDFDSATDDPWNGFDLMEGLQPPKPLENPDSLVVPPKDPITMPPAPSVSNPFEVTVPGADNPFDITVPSVDNPFHVTIPTVSNPFEIN